MARLDAAHLQDLQNGIGELLRTTSGLALGAALATKDSIHSSRYATAAILALISFRADSEATASMSVMQALRS